MGPPEAWPIPRMTIFEAQWENRPWVRSQSRVSFAARSTGLCQIKPPSVLTSQLTAPLLAAPSPPP